MHILCQVLGQYSNKIVTTNIEYFDSFSINTLVDIIIIIDTKL